MINATETKNVNTIIQFLNEIQINVRLQQIEHSTFLPGLCLASGTLLIDLNKLLYPGDILHEAGHLAVMPPSIRNVLSDDLPDIDMHRGGEMMAIAWSFAACIYLKLDPHIVFHADGYKNESLDIIQNFSAGRYIGVSLLQWNRMTYDDERAKTLNVLPYPNMISWVCSVNNYEPLAETV